MNLPQLEVRDADGITDDGLLQLLDLCVLPLYRNLVLVAEIFLKGYIKSWLNSHVFLLKSVPKSGRGHACGVKPNYFLSILTHS